jgi:sugar phosphate isomerase/epimerase
MIYASLDLDSKHIEDFLASLPDVKESKFDGVEICLWEDMRDYSSKIAAGLEKSQLRSNVHGDIMRISEGLENCAGKLRTGIEFAKAINADYFISHPIKPYAESLQASKDLLDQVQYGVLLENVRGIRAKQLRLLGKSVVLDIGNLITNEGVVDMQSYDNIKWAHIHDYKAGLDHMELGSGEIDLAKVIQSLPKVGLTLELGKDFRTWSNLKYQYRRSIDVLHNVQISLDSYGRNVRLQHFNHNFGKRNFNCAVDLGCGEGYLLHNVCAKEKIGYDMDSKPLFNDIIYKKTDLQSPINDCADLVICSEVLEHVQNDVAILTNASNILVPGGMLFLTTLNANIWSAKSDLDLLRGHIRRYDSSIEAKINEHGFKAIAFYPFRSKYYYQKKGKFAEYGLDEDICAGKEGASGWVYAGVKNG